ncbi:hypothetical protein D3C79_762520 [compost metagenome]
MHHQLVSQPLKILWLQAGHVTILTENGKAGLEPIGVNLSGRRLEGRLQQLPELAIGAPQLMTLSYRAELVCCRAVWKVRGIVEGVDGDFVLYRGQLVCGKLHVRLGDGEV